MFKQLKTTELTQGWRKMLQKFINLFTNWITWPQFKAELAVNVKQGWKAIGSSLNGGSKNEDLYSSNVFSSMGIRDQRTLKNYRSELVQGRLISFKTSFAQSKAGLFFINMLQNSLNRRIQMKKIILAFTTLAIIFSWFGIETAFATNKLSWTTAQQATWAQMRAENHPYWQHLLTAANTSGIYADRGMRDGLVYLITGDDAYARSAYRYVDQFCGRTYRPPESLTNPAWCTTEWQGKPAKDQSRDQVTRLAFLYSWIADALPAQDKANFRDILDRWTDLILNVNSENFGTRGTDSDEQVGHYFGIVLYALAIRDEDVSRSDQILNYPGNTNSGITTAAVGGVDSTGANYSTMRNTIARFSQRARGGQWIEGAEYNLTTLRYVLEGVHAINSYYGTDKFPEVTAMYSEYAKGLMHELTPDKRDAFQWGDIQGPRDLKLFNRVPLLNTLAGISKDPTALYFQDYFYNRHYPTTIADSGHQYLDPYSVKTAPSGRMSYNATGMGMAYYREGWNTTDSYFASFMFNPPRVDHDGSGLSHFELYRNGHWSITAPRVYQSGVFDFSSFSNGMELAGAAGRMEEASGQTGYESGTGYLYQAGATAGQLFPARRDAPPLEFIHEHNRSLLYFHHADTSDSIVIFDRINSCDPQDTSCMSTARFNNLTSVWTTVKNRIIANNSKHQWIIHLPDANPAINGNTITWRDAGGEEVTLKTFMNNYITSVVNESTAYGHGAPHYLQGYVNSGELKHQLRLIPNQKSGFQAFMNVVHVGSVLNATQLTSISGEQSHGVAIRTGVENTVAIFNGTMNPPPAPSSVNGPPNGFSATHNSQRLNLTKELRLFNQGFAMDINTTGLTKYFVADLDPAINWTIKINGNTIPVTVSSQGLANFQFVGAGQHRLTVTAEGGSSNQPPVAVISAPVINGLDVAFNGSQSYDPDNQPSPLTYFWEFGDNQTSTAMNPSHTYAAGGAFNVRLTVSDGQLTDPEVLPISVSGGGPINNPPVLNTIGDKTVQEQSNLSFGSSGTDPDSNPLSFSARLSNGNALSTIGATLTDNNNGTAQFNWTPSLGQANSYTLIFQVSDGQVTDQETIQVTVTSATQNPEHHWLETEYPISLVTPLNIFADGAASNGGYVMAPNGSGDLWTPSTKIVSYNVTITQPGEYILWGRIIAADNASDSFYVQVDSGTDNIWDTAQGTGWLWDKVSNRRGENPVRSILGAGTHTIKIKLREDGTKIDKLLLTNDVGLIPAGVGAAAENIPPNTGVKLYLETENYTSIVTPLRAANDTTASGGRYVYAPNGSGAAWSPGSSIASFSVNVPQAGTYILWGRVMGVNDDDSFYVQVDNGTNNVWDTTQGTSWQWDQVSNRGNPGPVQFNLTAGVHTIKIKLREDGTKIDKLLLTNDSSFTPIGMGQ